MVSCFTRLVGFEEKPRVPNNTQINNKVNIKDVIRNTSGFYAGDLRHYFKAVFFNARNWNNPYHNFRHIFHVLWLCYDACGFYRKVGAVGWTLERARNLLIAAIFHDYDHSGRTGRDDLEIQRAIDGLRKHIEEADKWNLEEIESIIKDTQFPYQVPGEKLGRLESQILRDADISQALSPVWLQQVIFGLALEMNVPPIKMLEMQESFLRNAIKPLTAWGQERFPQQLIDEKIGEAKALLELLQ